MIESLLAVKSLSRHFPILVLFLLDSSIDTDGQKERKKKKSLGLYSPCPQLFLCKKTLRVASFWSVPGGNAKPKLVNRKEGGKGSQPDQDCGVRERGEESCFKTKTPPGIRCPPLPKRPGARPGTQLSGVPTAPGGVGPRPPTQKRGSAQE